MKFVFASCVLPEPSHYCLYTIRIGSLFVTKNMRNFYDVLTRRDTLMV